MKMFHRLLYYCYFKGYDVLFCSRLRDALQMYEDQNQKRIRVKCVNGIPGTVLSKHLYEFWKAVVVEYRKKQRDS